MVLDLSDNILRAAGLLILSHPDVHLPTALKILSQPCPRVRESSAEVFHRLWIKFLPAQKQETHADEEENTKPLIESAHMSFHCWVYFCPHKFKVGMNNRSVSARYMFILMLSLSVRQDNLADILKPINKGLFP